MQFSRSKIWEKSEAGEFSYFRTAVIFSATKNSQDSTTNGNSKTLIKVWTPRIFMFLGPLRCSRSKTHFLAKCYWVQQPICQVLNILLLFQVPRLGDPVHQKRQMATVSCIQMKIFISTHPDLRLITYLTCKLFFTKKYTKWSTKVFNFLVILDLFIQKKKSIFEIEFIFSC